MDNRRLTTSLYDRYQRNSEHKVFYNSAAWKNVRAKKLELNTFCERCKNAVANHVHHIIPLAECLTLAAKLDINNLQSLCQPCHNSAEHDAPEAAFVSGQLEPVEDDEFYFNEDRASAVGRFAAKFCNHYRGTRKGEPFILHEIQQSIIRPTFGFLDRKTHLRRFNSLWLESGIGSGKTPLLAIIGLYGLLGDGEAGAQIYSVSNTFGQANHMFECAKVFIKNNPHLSKMVDRGSLVAKQYEIYHRPTDSRWHITSGSGAKAGGAASMILADEIHQIEDRQVYDDLQGRQSKRDQPLIVCATNAAARPQSLYADLHEEAAHTLQGGPRYNRRLFPVIWAAPKDCDPASVESWKLANPLIGVTIDENKVRDEWQRAKGSPALEARFRLQYLGQQVSDAEKWLDLDAFDECCKLIDPAAVKDAPLYLGLDSSGGDDLVALVKVWPTAEKFFVSSQFWLPHATAEKYIESQNVRYDKWSAAGDIELIEETTISVAVQERIAQHILDIHAKTPITALCYDRAYSESIIDALKQKGWTEPLLRPIGQGWGVSSGSKELDRRLKEKSIQFHPNATMKFCAQNVEIKRDDRGNYWPKKPGANGKNAGKRWAKIDGVSALVTALTEAKRHQFQIKRHVGAYLLNLDD